MKIAKSILSVFGAVTLVISIAGCTPEERVISGAAAGALIGVALSDNDVDNRHRRYYRESRRRYDGRVVPAPRCLAWDRYNNCYRYDRGDRYRY